MSEDEWKSLDNLLRLRLSVLPPALFERFFLDFLGANVSLTINRDGKAVTKRVITAAMYAPGSGREQKGIDLRLEVEGCEVWVVQCKQVQKWSAAQTREAIKKADQYTANHYFLAVACDTGHDVHDEIAKHPRWTLWNLDTICAEFRRRVLPTEQRGILRFLSEEEARRFMPFATGALISPKSFFERFIGSDKPLRHDWKIVGRDEELGKLQSWAEGIQKVFLLTARGGEGKTRLVREFCTIMRKERKDMEVLFLNPHRESQDFSFSFAPGPNASRRVFIVDDAHRAELAPTALLDLVRQDPNAKIILASRPQGEGSIASKLIETGFGTEAVQHLCLSPLKKTAARDLAKEVLGDPLKDYVESFLTLTEGNPFLITTAGGLIEQDRLKWGSWNNDKNFRQWVFHEFEVKNLDTIPESERPHASRLLRLVAILSPAAANQKFVEMAESLLECKSSIERLLNLLRQIELVVGPDEGLRVSPDLFADLLVYEACFEPKKKEPIWVKRVMESFPNQGAVLIRNISEACWIARINGVKDEKLLEPLLTWQWKQFRNQSFIERGKTLRYWSTFSIYLPKESLDLAYLAIQDTTAPKDSSPRANSSSINCHAHVLNQIPALLRPVAKYHFDYSQKALNVLWQLGCTQVRPKYNNSNHPWTVIAEVFKLERDKPVKFVLSALEWLNALIKKPETMEELAKPTPILRLFLEPCFSRSVEISWNEGRTIHLAEHEVDVSPTQIIRDRSLKILDWIIDHGTVPAVLDALGALQVAIRRPGIISARRTSDLEKSIAKWRPERLKALSLFRKTLEKHTDVVVRYEIRKTFKKGLAFEEDAVFAEECRQILALILEDLPLKVAVALSPDFAYEFEEIFKKDDPERFQKSREKWNQGVRLTASELAKQYPEVNSSFEFMNSLAGNMIAGEYSVSPYPLLMALGQNHPQLAYELADQIISTMTKTHLVQDWPALINNDQIELSQKIVLFEKAVKQKAPGARVAVIRQLLFETQQNQPLSQESQNLLFEIAKQADEQEAYHLLQLVEYSSEANLPWTFQLLESIKVEKITPLLLKAFLTALIPYQDRKTNPTREMVHHVYERFLAVPDLDFDQDDLAWDKLKELYPLEMYQFVFQRIIRASSNKNQDYMPLPSGLGSRLRLPELTKDPTAGAICEELWSYVTSSQGHEHWRWRQLFQAVVLEDDKWWHDRLMSEIGKASNGEELTRLAQLISFEGSLIIFGFPEIPKTFLMRAETLGGKELIETVRSDLYAGAGPHVRGYTNGQLDKEYDYLEAAALKAAEKHASDEVLGPFYRWIVEVEQRQRLANKLRAEAEFAE